MDDGGSPCFILGLVRGTNPNSILVTAVVVLLVVLIAVILLCYETLEKKLKAMLHGSSRTDEEVTEEEIISMVNEGHVKGVLQESEAEMIHNIFEFDDKEAKDIMTHRKNMEALDGNMTYADAMEQIIQSSRSRFPVYGEDIDDIIGVLHIKDALYYAQRTEVFEQPIRSIPDLVSPVVLIPETRKINSLFRSMQEDKSHMVIVVDEYGQTAGLVAMEDIIEEIVGNIEDEHDDEEEKVKSLPNGSYLMDGMTSLEDVEEILGIKIEEDSFDTLNGLLVSLFDKIPNDGECVEIRAYGYDFSVLKVENNMIKEVSVRKVKDPEVPLAQESKE